jgi:hypothetical protein
MDQRNIESSTKGTCSHISITLMIWSLHIHRCGLPCNFSILMLVIKLLLLFVKVDPWYTQVFYEKRLVSFNVYALSQMKWLLCCCLPHILYRLQTIWCVHRCSDTFSILKNWKAEWEFFIDYKQLLIFNLSF